MSRRVVVLRGGWSSEREVSLVSGRAVADALAACGYTVATLDVGRDVATLLRTLEPRPDVIFNALHGRYGEDGCIQGILEIVGIPYTHSGVLASALAMNKPMAKRLFVDAGLPCVEHRIVRRSEVIAGDPMPRPYVIKPLNEGSSVGVYIVRAGDNLSPLRDQPWTFGEHVMVERYVPGRELTVAVMGDRALGVTEIRPRQGFYDYRAKYTDGQADHLVPAPVHPAIYQAALDHALVAHRTLGCRGVSRTDMRYDDTGGEPGRLCILEVNTQPGMTPLSLVPEIAAAAGISFAELVTWMVENAACDA
ncbi:MAG: D-alanine--D-alanine ligase [Alphaproteobacteria bacterium]|nr:D-alanine--D-alanine ligase [Alphaproteobacteria bacterium]